VAFANNHKATLVAWLVSTITPQTGSAKDLFEASKMQEVLNFYLMKNWFISDLHLGVV